MGKHFKILVILLCFGSLCLRVFGNSSFFFLETRLQVPGEVRYATLMDMNGDGLNDLVIQNNDIHFPDPSINRMITLFFQDESGFLNPPFVLPLNSREIAFDVCDLDGDGSGEILILNEDMLYSRSVISNSVSGTFKGILKSSTVYAAPDPAAVPRIRFARDINGDNIPEILLPQIQSLNIYYRNQMGQYKPGRRLWMKADFSFAFHDQLIYTSRFPLLNNQDFNGDGRDDLLFIQEDRLDIFLQHDDTTSPDTTALIPYDFRYRMGARIVQPSMLNPLDPSTLTLETCDLNSDGYTDLLLSRASRASFSTSISQIQIFINKQGRFDYLPDQVLTAENFGGEHVIQDFNEDGLLDLGLLTFKLGFSQATRFLLTKKTGYSYRFYLLRPDDSFSAQPDGMISFSREVQIQTLLGTALCHAFHGDFNGDGIRDFLTGTQSDEISVYFGLQAGFFSKKPELKFRVPVSSHFIVQDVNQDGCSDLILWYPDRTDRADVILQISRRD